MRQKLRLNLLFILMLLVTTLCAGCEKTSGYIDFSKPQQEAIRDEQTAGKRPLKIAFASVMSPIETRTSYQEMVNHIAQRLGQPAVLVQRKTYEELNMLISNGEADVAFISTGAYMAYNGMIPIDILAMVQTDGTALYKPYLIVQADSDIHDFSQLRGKVMAFTDPLSYSGRIVIDYILQEQYQTTTEKFFKRCFYTYNHDKSLWAVANGLADGAGIDSQIYDLAVKTNPKLVSKVRIIEEMPPAPTGPVVMRMDLPEETKYKLQEIFFNMSNDQTLEQALECVMIDKFIAPEPELYRELKSKYNHKENLPGA